MFQSNGALAYPWRPAALPRPAPARAPDPSWCLKFPQRCLWLRDGPHAPCMGLQGPQTPESALLFLGRLSQQHCSVFCGDMISKRPFKGDIAWVTHYRVRRPSQQVTM